MLEASGAAALLWLPTTLCSIWNTGFISMDWSPGVVVPILKGKGDTQEGNNYKGITILCTR